MFTPQLTLSSALTYNLNLLDILMIALVCLLNALVVLYRHKENIQRFKNKNERKINDAKNV
jgi:glycerol-3-phosphate acyltransferase PlsY